MVSTSRLGSGRRGSIEKLLEAEMNGLCEEQQERAQMWGSREWNGPLWTIRRAGDGDEQQQRRSEGGHAADSFELRVNRVDRELKQRWNALRLGTEPPDRDAIVATIEATGGHAGRAVTSLLPTDLKSVSPKNLELLAGAAPYRTNDFSMLPEFMSLKIGDQRTRLEERLKESEEIQRKFMLLYKNENNRLDFELFKRFLVELEVGISKDEARHEFSTIVSSLDEEIDVYQFEEWMKHKIREDQRYASGLKAIGNRGAWAKIKLPHVDSHELEAKHGGAATRTQRFLKARQTKLKPSQVYWLEVTGSLMSVYESDEKATDPLVLLQLSDKEVVRVSVATRRPDGWGDSASDEVMELTEAEREKEDVVDGKLPHNARNSTMRTGANALMHAVNLGNSSRSVVEIWLQLEEAGDPLRVAIDLVDQDKERNLVQVWADTLRADVSFHGPHRPAAMLWASVSKKMKLVVQMGHDFGGLEGPWAAASRVARNEEIVLPWHIRHPDSTFTLVWDLLQIVTLLMVCWYVPLRTGFDIPVETWSYAFWQDLVIDLYFFLDLISQFRTAYYTRQGTLVTDLREIRVHYLQSWFVVDFACVLPVHYIGYLVTGSNDSGTSPRAVKSLRLLRLGKMLRLAKMFKMLNKYSNQAELRPLISLFMLFFLVFFASHLLACSWFVIGVDDQIMVIGNDGRVVGEHGSTAAEDACKSHVSCEETVVYGWVANKALEDEWWGRLGRNATLSTRYITSMYGIFNSLENGFTDAEKIFAIIADQIVGSVIYGSLAAVLSALLIESGQKSKEFNQNYRALKTWMQTRQIKRAIQRRVLAAYSHKFKDSTAFDQEEMLKLLPPDVSNKLIDKLYGDFIRSVPYFKGLGAPVIHKLALATRQLHVSSGTSIIQEHAPAYEMYILVQGEVVVEVQGVELGFLGKGAFFGEGSVIDPRRNSYR